MGRDFYISPEIQRAIDELRYKEENKGIPDEWWKKLRNELYDGRLYLKIGQGDRPTFKEALMYAENAVRSWHANKEMNLFFGKLVS